MKTANRENAVPVIGCSNHLGSRNTRLLHLLVDGLLSPNPVREGKSCRHSGIGGDERVYQGLSEAVQSRLTSLDSLTIRSLIGL